MVDTWMQKQIGANILSNRIKWKDCDSRRETIYSGHVGINSMGNRLYWLFSYKTCLVAGYSEQMGIGFLEQGTIRR